MRKQLKKSRILCGVAMVALGVAVVLMICGLSGTIGEVDEDVISRTPDAILASAGLTDGETVSLPVTYYDQKADECVDVYDAGTKQAIEGRQFEWSDCGYYNQDVEQGIVEYNLDENSMPVAVGGKLTTNRGVVGDSKTDSNFKQWFTEVDGKSVNYAGIIKMNYKEAGADFSFYKNEFYPLDGAENKLGDESKDSHNHLFTMYFAVPFMALLDGQESLEITADDDTFVFVGDKLAVDMGGIHGAVTGRLKINEDGEVYESVGDEDFAYTGISLMEGESSLVRVFHADRDSSESVFKIDFRGMDINVINSQLAEKQGDSVQIAYDPNDPNFMPPLGASMAVKPSAVKEHIILATIEGFAIVVFAVLLAIAIRFGVKSYRERK